jgi:sortase A
MCFFCGLRDISLRDTIELVGPRRTDAYVVDQIKIVDPKDVSVLNARSQPTLTLVTCYRFYYGGSAPQRQIVQASIAGH